MSRMGLTYIGVVSFFRRAIAGIVLAVLLAPAAEATQYGAIGTITIVQSFWAGYLPNETGEAGAAVFQVSSGVGNGCNWLYVGATDKNTLAALLTAKATGANVTIYYDNTLTSPWGDTTICAAQVIQQN